METNLLARGFELMLVGMGTVFVFLTALVMATTLMSWLVARGDAHDDDAAGGERPGDEEVAAIAAAIRLHRSR